MTQKPKRLTDMTDKELLAHTKKSLKLAMANGNDLSAHFLADRVIELQNKIRQTSHQ